MDDRTRALEQLYRDRYVAFRNTLATVTEVTTRPGTSCRGLRTGAPEAAIVPRRGLAGSMGLADRVSHRARAAQGASWRSRNERLARPGTPEPDRDPDLAAALRCLPPRKRLVVFLHYFADLSYGEIAHALGISEGTVAAMLSQARAMLVEALDREGARK
jgi:Sigma-70, region 4